jgi:hypothetical protein
VTFILFLRKCRSAMFIIFGQVISWQADKPELLKQRGLLNSSRYMEERKTG